MDPNKPSECPVRDRINSYCPCPKEGCPNHGICCECILAHKNRTQDPVLKRLPSCLRGMVQEALES
jgi:hypothetical protein